jgi:hypothetical protein
MNGPIPYVLAYAQQYLGEVTYRTGHTHRAGEHTHRWHTHRTWRRESASEAIISSSHANDAPVTHYVVEIGSRTPAIRGNGGRGISPIPGGGGGMPIIPGPDIGGRGGIPTRGIGPYCP